MLTYQDEQRIKQLTNNRLDPLEKTVNTTADNVDKILKIVTDEQKENVVLVARVNQHYKRLSKVERKLGFSPPLAVAIA